MLASPLGAMLQSALVAAAVRRWVGYPSGVDTPRSALLFFVVLVPLGHSINASLTVPLLVWASVIRASEAWFSWWSWWQGDALGAVLATPLVLVALGQPAHAWRPRWTTVALPMLGAMAVVAVAFVQVQVSERGNLGARFDQESNTLTERLQHRLSAQTDALLAVARLMEVVDGRNAEDFRLATATWLQRYGGTQNFGWSPLVRDADRLAFERQVSQEDQIAFRINGRSGDGALYPAQAAPRHFPIRFVEPLGNNRAVLGLDVSVFPATAGAVRAAVATRLPEVSEGFRLVQETGDQRGVVMYQAPFARHRSKVSGGDASEPLGVVSAVFRMDDVLRAAVGHPDPEYLALCLLDLAAPDDNQRLAGLPGCGGQVALKARFFSSRTVTFGERVWLFQVSSGPLFESRERGWTAWGTLTVSLLAVAMLGAFLIVITGQARRTEYLVVERTRDLGRSNAELQALALYDPLTGLSNRAHWLSEAREALDAARRAGDALAVLFVDLDHFKDVNDGMGHGVGDELLQSVARQLRSCLRSHDLIARQGGDEFVVLLDRLRSRDDAAAIAAKMVELLGEPFVLQGKEVRVSASVGLEWFDGQSGASDIETLLRHADTAMYAAKAAGRNGWCFFVPEMDQSLAQRLLVESGLRRAMAQDELLLHYQPQLCGRTGEVLGVEALVRWRHPELGLLMPDRFIPQAENSGQIDELGGWVMQHACAQLRLWHEAGVRNLTMAVNVSAVEFARPGFIPRLRRIMDSTGIQPDWLELEIAESALMQALPDLIERLGDINRMGVSLSLDDFGTGYSSLGYLKRLPLHRLKIDRSFVRDLPGDKEDEAIVRATLSMAHALGLEVVAEGVELATQRDFLVAEGCDHLQGWLVARPMDADAFVNWWRVRQKI
jgi:diguanylate cyclase (GGDEF)-like protein